MVRHSMIYVKHSTLGGQTYPIKTNPLDFLGLQLYKERPVVKIDGYDKTLICISTRPQRYTVYIYRYAYTRNKQFETRNQLVFLYVL